MSTPDPFADFEPQQTIVKPKPRVPGSGPTPAAPGASGTAAPEIGELKLLNPLVSAAAPLLVLIGKLRNLVQPPNLTELRAACADAVSRFEPAAERAGASRETVLAARYVLCTALDESVAQTPWGVQAGWNKQSLLVQFHNETWGGEKVFQLLARLAQDVPKHRSLLELLYAVLALGFEGRYRVLENGRAQLDAVRQRLADLIAKDRPPLEADLSPHWRVAAGGQTRLRDALPLWVIGAGLALLLTLVWFGLRVGLNERSDTTYASIAGLQVVGAQVPSQGGVARPPPPVSAKAPRLAGFLEPEIRQGLVTVTDSADRSVVRLAGDSVFGSGSAEPKAQTLPLLKRIGEALAAVPGAVRITGHSDNVPIRSLRYPSNWHLSAARAQGVLGELARQVDPARLHAEGKADAEPLDGNDTLAGRARNRRVEIELLAVSEQNAAAAEVKR